MGQLCLIRRPTADARRHLTRAGELAATLGLGALEAYALRGLGDADLVDGRPAEAIDQYGRGLRLARTAGDRAGEMRCQAGLADASGRAHG